MLAAGLLVANCGSADKLTRTVDPKYGVAASARVVDAGKPVPKGGGYRRVGNPYTIAGRTFVPRKDPNYRAEGIASWYGSDFHGRLTANGEVYDKNSISAAHPTLPIPSYVRVTNLSNRRSLIVRVNDRGPFHGNRIIDLSARSAELLGFRGNGLARVRVEYVGQASLDGSDDRRLLATLRRDGGPASSAPVMLASASPGIPAAALPRPGTSADPVPSPSARPYELGRYASAASATGSGEARPAPRTAAAPAAAPPAPRPVQAASLQTARASFTPISGYAAAALTGRGLY